MGDRSEVDSFANGSPRHWGGRESEDIKNGIRIIKLENIVDDLGQQMRRNDVQHGKDLKQVALAAFISGAVTAFLLTYVFAG